MADAVRDVPITELERGDPAPWFRAAALSGNADYAFDTVAGRHVLMLFLGSAGMSAPSKALEVVLRHRQMFDDVRACFFGISVDPTDEAEGRIEQQIPGIRFFLDYDRKISALYGACSGKAYRPRWILLDPSLRVLASFSVNDGESAISALTAEITAKRRDEWAPVLLVPNVLESELCDRLIAGYEAAGGEESGFMRDVGGKTRLVVDPRHKQRRDWNIDGQLRQTMIRQINRHLIVPIQRAYQFSPTRIERHIVACYVAGAGHFRPHRDNTTKGTAHRRFAVTINLNATEYDGGDLCFPEFGSRTYRAPTGGGIVFSCSLLHEATPVTRGKRYAYLPFLYDEEGAAIREANNPHLDENVGVYRRGRSPA